MTNSRRQAEINRLREEGYAAAREGRTRAALPAEYQRTMNAFQWLRGFESFRPEDETATSALLTKAKRDALIDWLMRKYPNWENE